eukprot:268161-Heterocapsa_arctica.AAC.1
MPSVSSELAPGACSHLGGYTEWSTLHESFTATSVMCFGKVRSGLLGASSSPLSSSSSSWAGCMNWMVLRET